MSTGPSFSMAVNSMQIIHGPFHEHESMSGYIETEVEFGIKDLQRFTNIWESWNHLSDKRKLEAYGLAKGLGDCK